METDSSLIGANSIVVLYPIAHIGLHISRIVYPSNPEGVYFIGNDQSLDQVRFLKLWMLVINLFYRFYDLFNGLKIFRFIRKTSFHKTADFFGFHKKTVFNY